MLTAAKVEHLFVDSLVRGPEGGKEFEGIVSKAIFREEKLEEHRAEIEAMLMELPEMFRRSVGGGWSFLNGCLDNKGEQWTGEHRIVEYLMLLGMGIGKVTMVTPRAMWPALPGGVPYFAIEDGLDFEPGTTVS